MVRTSLLSSLAFSSAIVSPNSLTTLLHSEAETWVADIKCPVSQGEPCWSPWWRCCWTRCPTCPTSPTASSSGTDWSQPGQWGGHGEWNAVGHLVNLWILMGRELKLLLILLKLESFLANLKAMRMKRKRIWKRSTCSIDFSRRSKVCLISS